MEGIWYFEGEPSHRRERHFPHGRFELVIHLEGVYGRVEEGGTRRLPVTGLSGLRRAPGVIEAPRGRSAVLGIRLHALGAFALLGRPLDALTGLDLDLEELIGRTARELAGRCAEAPAPEDRLRAAAAWLEARFRSSRSPAAAVTWAAGELERSAGRASIARIRARTGFGKTRFTSTFRRQVGVTAKAYARILRFRRALELVERGTHSLGRVALAAGYYDQPHFNREFRTFSGLTPRAYVASRRFPASVNLLERAD